MRGIFMRFTNDIYTLKPEKRISFTIGKDSNIKLPTAQNVFFRSKQDEIIKQYESARLFLRETVIDDLDKWVDEYDKRYEETFKLLLIERMFEAALIYYNIIVDLSWTLCYVSIEYALYKKDSNVELNSFISIEDAYNAMRKAENLVTNPDIEGNPLVYLKFMCPEFEEAIELVIEFWRKFKDRSIRNLYNFIKHKGKPAYSEVESILGNKLMSLKIDGNDCPIDIRDVKMEVELGKSINDLKDFDDKTLFPYIKKLFELLEEQINPSEIIFY